MISAPGALRAQQKAMPVIGFLGLTSPGAYALQGAAFHQGLSETGYAEGQNVTIEYSWAEDHYDRLPALFADLVDRKVYAIFAGGGLNGALEARPRRSRSSLSKAATRSSKASWPVSPGRAETSPG